VMVVVMMVVIGIAITVVNRAQENQSFEKIKN
jgi:hypothetical protein